VSPNDFEEVCSEVVEHVLLLSICRRVKTVLKPWSPEVFFPGGDIRGFFQGSQKDFYMGGQQW